ncbi:MAG: hypothetical protein U9N57_03410 [Pseudomonadota bacterium]|nr:hypothetical protein [Pseudomonadota bacterium]
MHAAVLKSHEGVKALNELLLSTQKNSLELQDEITRLRQGAIKMGGEIEKGELQIDHYKNAYHEVKGQ